MDLLQEDYIWVKVLYFHIKEQIENSEAKLDNLKRNIEDNILQKEHLIENRNLLLDNIKLKMQEQKDKIQQLAQLEKNDLNNSKHFDKQKYDFDPNRISKLLEFTSGREAEDIVESLIDTFKIAKNEVIKVYEKDSYNNRIEILYIGIYYEQDTVNFRVCDEYYSFNDLLNDICRYYDINMENYRLFDNDGNLLNMILSVKAFIENSKKKNIQSSIYLKSILEENQIVINAKKNDVVEEIVNNIIETGDIITNIEDIEDDLLEKIGKIIMYLIFLMLIYTYLISKYQIPAIYLVNSAIKSQIYYAGFYKQNKYGLENNFQNLVSIKDINLWLTECFTNAFDFYDSIYIIKKIMMIHIKCPIQIKLYQTLFIGKIRFLQILQPDAPNYNNYSFDFIIDEYKDFFKNINQATIKRPLDVPYFYSGEFEDYPITEAYYVDTFPTLKDNLLQFALFRNTNWLNSNTKFFALTFNGYNYNMDFYITVTLALEQNTVGRVKTNYKVCVLNVIQDLKYLKQFKSSIQKNPIYFGFNITIMFMIYLYSFVGVYDIIMNIIGENRWKYLFYYWNWIYIFKVTVYLVTNILRLYLLLVLRNKLEYRNDIFIDNSNECNVMDYMELCETVSLSLSLIYFLQYLDKNIIGPIFETLINSFKNIVIFISSYFFILIGFTFFANFVYGIYILKFVTFTETLINLFFMIFGDYSILNQMDKTFPFLTSAFVVMFGISFYILFSNWLTASLMLSYNQYQKQLSSERERTGTIIVNLFDEIGIIYKKFFRSGLIFVKRTKRKIEEILAKRLLEVLKKKQKEEEEKEKLNVKEGENKQDEKK